MTLSQILDNYDDMEHCYQCGEHDTSCICNIEIELLEEQQA